MIDNRFSDCLSRLTGMMFIGGLILEKTYAFLNDVNEVSIRQNSEQ